MVDFTDLARLDDQADRTAKSRRDQRAVDGRQSEDDRDRRGGRVPVRQDDDPRAGSDGLDGAPAEVLEGDVQRLGESRRQGRDGIAAVGDLGKAVKFVVSQDRATELDQASVFRRLLQNVPAVADVGHQRHHELLADRVDRRVGHLREELVEAVEERAAHVRAAGECGVVAHRADGFLAVPGHRLENELEILLRIAEPLLPARQVARDLRGDDLREQTLDRDAVLLDPAAVGTPTGVAGLDFGVLEKPVRGKVEIDHRAWLDAAVPDDVLRVDVQDAGLRGEHEEVVPGERPAGGTEAVPVEGRARRDAVREGHGGGAVPRLHERGVVLVEAAHVMAHVVLGAPGLRHQHEHRVGGIAAGCDEKLEHVVERRRVGLTVLDKREDLPEVVPEERRGEVLLA